MNPLAHAQPEKVGDLPKSQPPIRNFKPWNLLVNELIRMVENSAKSIAHKGDLNMNQAHSEERTNSSDLKVKAFVWDGALWVWSKPVKTLFHSTTIYEVVTRGDRFATRLSDGVLTVVPKSANVLEVEIKLPTTATIKFS